MILQQSLCLLRHGDSFIHDNRKFSVRTFYCMSASEVTKADWRPVVGRILEAFAGDELHVIPSKEIRSPKRQKLCDKACELREKLKEKLNNEEKELLNELMDVIADENCSYAQSKFIRGYCLGVQMTMEVMSEQETFFD